MQDYFTSERNGNIVGVGIGALLLIFYLIFQKNIKDSLWLQGLSYPWRFLILFCLMIGYSIYTNTVRSADFTARYLKSPVQLVSKELARMENMDSWWLPLNITWIVFMSIGLIGLLIKAKSFFHGITAGVLIIGLLGFTTDYFAKKQALDYKEKLQKEYKRLNVNQSISDK